MKYIIAPSVLSAHYNHLYEDLLALNNAGCEYVHFDVMDGMFVPQISFGEPVLKGMKEVVSKFFDVHLMVMDPIKNVESFVKAGADLITFHLESKSDVNETIDLIHSFGIKAGISVKPGTKIEEVYPLLDKVEMVLVMTVEPGYGGQSYIEASDMKIAALRNEIEKRGLQVDIEVDGGISLNTLDRVKKAGANVFVSGSSLFKGDMVKNVEAFRKLLES